MNKYEEIEKRRGQGVPVATSAKDLGASVSGFYAWRANQKKKKAAPIKRAVRQAKLRMETVEVPMEKTTDKLFMFVGSVEQFKNLLGKI